MAASSIHFPDELIELILTKSPVKSVLRFRSVSKSWKSIISDPRFSRAHLIQRSMMPENQNKFFIRKNHYIALIRLDEDGKPQTESDFDFGFKVVCSCNGLLLLVDESRQDKRHLYMLWNLSIHKQVTIHAMTPRTKDHNTFHLPWRRYLYYDSVTDDFKIVLAYTNSCAVFSCMDGSWDMKDFPSNLDLMLYYSTTAAFVNGCFYSLCNGGRKITCFDSRDGKVQKFQKPDQVDYLFALDKVSGRLCLHGSSKGSRRGVELWMMEETDGSLENRRYTKLTSKENLEDYVALLRREQVWWRNEDDHVVFGTRVEFYEGVEQFIWNPYENKRAVHGRGFEQVSLEGKNRGFDAFPYLENLYMPSL